MLCIFIEIFNQSFISGYNATRGGAGMHWKELISQTDYYLVTLSSKTYVFEHKMTKS